MWYVARPLWHNTLMAFSALSLVVHGLITFEWSTVTFWLIIVCTVTFFKTQNCLVVLGYFRTLLSDQGFQIIVTSEWFLPYAIIRISDIDFWFWLQILINWYWFLILILIFLLISITNYFLIDVYWSNTCQRLAGVPITS